MPSLANYQSRRRQFLDRIEYPVLLMAGGWSPRTYPGNPYPYRADSNFLFFFAGAEPGAAALFDPAEEKVTLYLPRRTADDALWHGTMPSFDEMKAAHGVDAVVAVEDLQDEANRTIGGRPCRTLAVADPRATNRAIAITGETHLDFHDARAIGHPELVQAIGQLRAFKTDEELEEMRKTASITREAHLAAMRWTRPGVLEQDLAGRVTGTFAQHGCVPAYNNILSVRGEVLHNNEHDNEMRDGDLIILDAGAEAASGYCSDVTRSWPVSGTWSCEQAEIYETVLAAEKASIEAVRPGVRYRDLHLTSARVLTEGLVAMGLMKGEVDGLVESGAHAVFFPHGVGHLIGLDVHDMEAFGDAIAYPEGRSRSSDFGTRFLRLDMDCAPGMAFTIEPGIYFVPAILHNDELREQFADQIDFAKAEEFLKANDGRGFGGVRIEDDVVCTEDGFEVLTHAIPKERREVEAEIGAAVE